MPVYSAAQALPLLVLERVFRYLTSVRPAIPNVEAESAGPERKNELVPFMSLCRAWRSVAAAMHYRSAKMWPKLLNPDRRTFPCYVTLDEIVGTGNQRYLRDLTVHVFLPDFVNSGEEHATLASTLANSGDLSSVCNLHFDVTLSAGSGRSFQLDINGTYEWDVIGANLNAFIKQLRHQLPNAHNVGLHKWTRVFSAAGVYHMDNVLDKAHELIGPSPTSLALCSMPITKRFVSNMASAALRSITIAMHTGSQQHVELVRRNAPCLEYLRICKSTHFSVIKMTCDPRNNHGMVMYPRLRTLIIENLTGSRTATVRQPLADPFPRLHTLVSRGHFPFRTPGVLNGGRSHVCHLDMDMDGELLAILDSTNTLEKGAFSKLHYVSLKWVKNSVFHGAFAERLCRLSAELSAHTRVARNCASRISRMAELASLWQFSTNLETLDMPHCEFNIDQCITVLCGNLRLIKANISMAAMPGTSGSSMPPLNILTEYQNKYRSSTSNVRAIGIRSVRFNSCRQAAENLLLLADILDSIKRITVSFSCRRDHRKILNAIEFAKRRNVYKGHSVHHRVLFSSGSDW